MGNRDEKNTPIEVILFKYFERLAGIKERFSLNSHDEMLSKKGGAVALEYLYSLFDYFFIQKRAGFGRTEFFPGIRPWLHH